MKNLLFIFCLVFAFTGCYQDAKPLTVDATEYITIAFNRTATTATDKKPSLGLQGGALVYYNGKLQIASKNHSFFDAPIELIKINEYKYYACDGKVAIQIDIRNEWFSMQGLDAKMHSMKFFNDRVGS